MTVTILQGIEAGEWVSAPPPTGVRVERIPA
jgi:hypothetical protein